MDLGDVESSLRVLVLGSSNVGKTSLTAVYCRGELPGQHKKTIGVDFREKNIYLEEACEDINLMMWEVGGDHVDAQMAQKYFKDANAAILVFAADDRESFDRIPKLADKVRRDCGRSTRLVLVENKIDLGKEAAQVSDAEAQELAREVHARLYRVSCRDPQLVEEVFLYVAAKCVGAEAVALTDICDVVPEVDDSKPEDSANSVEQLDAREEQDAAQPSHDPAPKQILEIQDQNSVHSAGEAPIPQSSAPAQDRAPLVPSKQRTQGKKKHRSCIIS